MSRRTVVEDGFPGAGWTAAGDHPRTTSRLRSWLITSAFGAVLIGSGLAANPFESASRDQELFNQGKILIFDKKWEEARQVFVRVTREFPSSPLVPQAFYFQARCLQLQGRQEDAVIAYETFLQKYPGEPVLAPEARNSVVELAAMLCERGDPRFKDRLVTALSDANKDVRYFAAIRSSGLQDRQLNSMTAPVLKEIVRRETQRDLVDRARIALLRLDPKALSAPQAEAPPEKRRGEPPAARPAVAGDERMFHLVVYRKGMAEPAIELNLPVSLAELAIAALDESAKAEIRKKGIDLDNVWESLKKLGPTNILTLRDGDNLIKIWVQ